MPSITNLLLLANFIVFGLEALFGEPFLERYALWPIGPHFHLWQVVTSAFLHANLMHIGANMFGLWMFGRDVERALGTRRFLALYFLSALTAAAAQLVTTAVMGSDIPTLGASGAVFGILGAFALLFPRRVIILLLPPIPLPAPLFVLLYAGFELFSGVYGTEAGVAHFAHLGGLAGGLLMVWNWRRRR